MKVVRDQIVNVTQEKFAIFHPRIVDGREWNTEEGFIAPVVAVPFEPSLLIQMQPDLVFCGIRDYQTTETFPQVVQCSSCEAEVIALPGMHCECKVVHFDDYGGLHGNEKIPYSEIGYSG